MRNQSLDTVDFAKQDPEEMYQHIISLIPGFLEWWTKAEAFPLPAHYVKVNKVLLSGMGGSGQGGSIVKDLVAGEAKVPIEIIKDYHLPAWVDSSTLVIAVSYSGTTEETVSTFIEAYEKGAKLLGIGTGGQIASLARKYKVPYFEHSYKSQPRAALHVHLAALLNIFSRLGYVTITNEQIQSLSEVQKLGAAKWVESIPEGMNEAKQLAQRLAVRVPIIIGDGALQGVAIRYKAQINENAKTPAYFEILPEMNHNALLGTEYPKESRDWLHFIILDSQYTDEQNKTRAMLTEQLLRDRRYAVVRKTFEASSPLQEVMAAIHFGDFVSYYLALLHQVDPTPVGAVDDFKSKLGH